ncbi:mycofactocin biosynthesis glycosyltransferase MftF [Microbacterium sp. SORGH_AS_0888]|uniref:mycofactocin biosynthesis glycosyltransferase MftF n=1 Tax=Microbacterium sp. SORGH_AS_0888 TaxID=3041791 RepID=UPI002786F241|nr:mycofactocin biosynthesis glycosyltransferase MftF [Microbacterium sp. SORGH_AS_0888]MDQ1129682.1 mycofactocin system glycosyltransferase [Microbacterium sp. SORGH_AS_0888]
MSVPRVHVGTDVWRLDDGRVLVGGAPLRVVRLGGAAVGETLSAEDAASARRVERLLEAGLAHPDPAELDEVSLDELTVVVPVFGRAAPLDRLLAGLGGVRVVVVDDGTPQPAAADLAAIAERHGAQLLRLARNAGPASARNAGMAIARTPFVAFVDSDVEVGAEELGRLLRHFADPGLALVGPRIVGAGGSSWIARYENARSSVDLGARPALVRPRSPVAWLSSTCLVARRSALGEGFTAGRRVAEDVDLVWRLAEAGQRVRYEPRVAVRHTHRARLAPWFARKLFYGTGAADLAADHPSAIVPAILRPWSIGMLIALCAGRRWSLPAAAAITLGAAWRLRGRLPEMRGRSALAVRLAGSGALSAVAQLSALALRHWWPAAAVLCVFSRRARWIVAGLAIVDAEVERRRTRSDLDPLRFLVARRLDDIAYGAGVWLGCVRRRSFRALRPELWPPR